MKIRNYLFLLTLLVAVSGCDPDSDNVPKPDDERDDYTGSWTLEENSQLFGTSSYQVQIKKSSVSSNSMTIDNFYNLGGSHSARVTISDKVISIPSQTVSGHTLSGNGKAQSSKSITLDFTINDGSGEDVVSASLSR